MDKLDDLGDDYEDELVPPMWEVCTHFLASILLYYHLCNPEFFRHFSLKV